MPRPTGTSFCKYEYTDKILRGSRSGGVARPSAHQIRLVINLQTAKALGLTIPPSLLLRANRVIE
jgi:putative tryptophan/tyrosine transport system substrate-binding protein